MALTALLSVSDKTGIVEFAQALHAQGVRLLSTGGTAKLLAEKGLPVTEVSEVTQLPRNAGRPRQDPAPHVCTAASWPAATCPSTWRP